jgi:LuxR family maltose regulon positive regulatory protein
MVHLELNNLEEAARHLADGIALCRQVGYLFDQVVGYSTLARVRQAQRDWDGTRGALQSAERASQRMEGYLFARRWVEDCKVRLWSAQDRASAIAAWLQETDLGVDDPINFGRELEHIILARALVAVGREQPGEPHLADALDLLARLLETAESAGWMGKAIEILTLQALAYQAQGKLDQALSVLARALSLGEPEGYVRTFVDGGPPMARLLYEAVARGIATDYARNLLVVFATESRDRELALSPPKGRTTEPLAPSTTPSAGSGQAFGPPSFVEPLSERELEVLQLMAQGLTNKEIASRLYLAPSTVKVHTRNIYGKLGVHNRTQAVTLTRDLGLL